MDGLAYLLAIVAVGLVILWARTNDRVPLDGETTGFAGHDATAPDSATGRSRTSLCENAPQTATASRMTALGKGTGRQWRAVPNDKSYLAVFLFIALSLLVQTTIGAFRSDLGLTADEAAHFVTAAMMFDYLADGSFSPPMAFALKYYEHFPRVAIGHWPPFFHIAQSLFFFLTGPTVSGALLFQAVIAGFACGIPAVFAQRRWGLIAGLAAGFLVFLSPTFLFLIGTVMTDNFSGVMVLLAALSWGLYGQKRSWRTALLFAGVAICATMTKGNAIGLALLPLFQGLLTRDLRLFRSGKTWAIALMVAIIAVPWYAYTYQIASAGFNYSFGWSFTGKALPAYSMAFVKLMGIPALAGVLLMLYREVSIKYRSDDIYISALLSAVMAIFLFQAVAPADIQPRYLISALPAAAPLAVGGLVVMARWASTQAARAFRPFAAGPSGQRLWPDCLVALAAFASLASVFIAPHARSLGMDKVAEFITKSDSPNPLVLICASPNGEGAAIAAFTALERRPDHYVIRGTQALSSGNFMGTEYQSRFSSADDLAQWVLQHHIGWLVIDNSPDSLSWKHNQVVAAMLAARPAGWRKLASLQHEGGSVDLYALPASASAPAETAELLEEIRPQKLSAVRER